MKKAFVVCTVISMVLSVSQPAIAANPKYGAPCSKLNLEKEFQSINYLFIKVKGKLVWTGKQSEGSESSKTSSKKLPADFVDIKGRMVYGISNGMLTRFADSGKTFQTDSRKISVFDTTRVQAFNELNKNPRLISHPNVQFEFMIGESFPKKLTPFIKREFDEAAALWENIFKDKIKVKIYLLTEKDRDFIKTNQWLVKNVTSQLDRLESRGERPFIVGGAGYWNHEDSSYGEIYLDTLSDLDFNYVNYEWPEVAKHEFVHIVQDYFFRMNGEPNTPNDAIYKKMRPVNYTEGSANTIAFLTAFRNQGWSADALDWNLLSNLAGKRWWMKIDSIDSAKKMLYETDEGKSSESFDMSYPIGALLYEYVIAKYSFDGFKKLISETSKQQPYEDTIKNSLGISKDELYSAASSYIYSAVQRVKPY